MKTSEKLEKLLNKLIDEFDKLRPIPDSEKVKDLSISINEISEAYNKIKSVEFLLGSGMPIGDLVGGLGQKIGN